MHKRVVARCNQSRTEDLLIEEMGNSLSWICLGVLEGKTDEFGFKLKKLMNLFDFVEDEKQKWHRDEKDTDLLLAEAKGKRGHVYEACSQVPTSQLLYLADPKRRKMSTDTKIRMYLQCGYCIIGVWLDTVLQEHYRMNVEARKQVFLDMNNWIDSYQRGYLSNKGINEMFIEDLGFNMATGERLNETAGK